MRTLGLFGSAARDELLPDSDIDILVEFEGRSTSRGYFGTLFRLEDVFGRPVVLASIARLYPNVYTFSMKGYTTFDAADYLKDEEVIAEYLTAALEDPNQEVFLLAVRDVARARGMAELASNIGVGRESLYKALAPGAKPRYDTVLKVMRGFGVQLSASPRTSSPKARAAKAVKGKRKSVRAAA